MNSYKFTVGMVSFLLLLFFSDLIAATSKVTDLPELRQGVDSPINIKFDDYGIPHIYAHTNRDLFYAQGYVHASARWWQMEWYRHTGQGRLAELVGAAAVPDDALMHTFGIPGYARRDAASLTGDSANLLDAYIAGVNGWLVDKSPDELAPEYALLEFEVPTVDAWRREDSIVLQSLQALAFNENSLLAEVITSIIADQVGTLFISAILPPYPYDSYPVTMSPGELPGDEASTELLDTLAALPQTPFGYETAALDITGSNAWVVSGELTETGMPLLANDTHMGVRMPSYWYQVGLHCVELTPECTYDVSGMSIPGSPGVIIGHNQAVSWGFTNAQTDMIDLYELELNPENPGQYRYQGEFVDMTSEVVELGVADGDPIEITVNSTVFGPVIEQFDGIELPNTYALRWTVADGNRAVDAIFAANRATNWEEFQTAFSLFDAPGLNVFYADTDGNIGYLLSGRIPIRAEGHQGNLPMPGDSESILWQGYVDPMQTPRLFNPDAGYILSANNAMIDVDAFPYPIAYFYDYGFRARRIEALIQANIPHAVADFERMLFDTWHPAAPFLVPILETIEWEDPALAEAVTWLRTWDYTNDVDDPQAALFNVFLANLMLYGLDELPLYEASHSTYLLSLLVETPTHPLWANVDLSIAGRDDIMRLALRDAWTLLNTQLGSDYENWRWGDLHEIYFEPELIDYISVEGDIRAQMVPSLPVPGTMASVNVSNFNPLNPTLNAISLPSMRMIVDLQDFDNSRFVNSTGQSGDFRSIHYADMVPLWATGVYLEHHFSPEAVEQNTQTVWELSP